MSDWRRVSFDDPEHRVWPDEWADREQWMGHTPGDKKPYAPWADRDHPAADADDDARWKWGLHSNWTSLDEVRKWVEMSPELAGQVYLLQSTEQEPFAFIDGDDVRDPQTGEVHEGFISILNKLGMTYGDISTSGSGVHAVYYGDLPDGVKQAKLQLDTEPFGSNDDLPVCEIYDHSKVCVATGDHLPETPTEVREWDADELEALLEAHGLEPGVTESSEMDLDDYDADATDGDELTTDVRDVAAAVDRLDARRVAEDTVVYRWNDDASTSGKNRAFVPVWGPSANGTANIVDDEIWQDTGGNGYGGPVVMAAIDCPDLSFDESTQPSDVDGADWWRAVEHLRESLGYSIPEHVDLDDLQGPDQTEGTDETEAATDGGAVSDSPSEPADDAPEPPEPEPAPDTPEPSEGDEGGDDGGGGDGDGDGSGDEELDWDRVYQLYAAADGADERLPARFNATELLDQEMNWRALVENDVLYCYDTDTGVYRAEGESRLREQLVQNLNEQFRVAESREIAEQLRGRHMIKQEQMGGPANKIAATNGVVHVDRDSVRLEDHDPDHEFLNGVDTRFDPDADCPRFRQFLQESVQTEADRKKLQEYAGYCLHHWGLPFHKALFLVGPTASGKSTFLDTVRAMLGDDATTSFTPQEMTEERFAGAELYGKWANIRNDIPSETVKNTGHFKEITAGDPMKAEEKYKDPFHFEPDAKHLFSANQLPETETDDEAFYRRILLIAFPTTVPRSERDTRLDEKLQAELPGVLNWAVEGLQRLLQQGEFTADRKPGRTQDTWEKWGNSISRFESVGIEEDTDSVLSKKRAYQAYIAYCESEGIPTETQHKFTRYLKSEGVDDGREYVDGSRERVFLDVTLTGRAEGHLDGDGGRDDRSDGGSGTNLNGY